MTGKNIPGDIGTDQIPSGNCLWYYEGLATTTSAALPPLPRSLYSSPFLASFFLAPRRRSHRPQERQQPASKPELAPQLPANPWTALLSTSCYLLVRSSSSLPLPSTSPLKTWSSLFPFFFSKEQGDVCKILSIFSFWEEGEMIERL